MSTKRDTHDTSLGNEDKKPKIDNNDDKKDELTIDSELLAQQGGFRGDAAASAVAALNEEQARQQQNAVQQAVHQASQQQQQAHLHYQRSPQPGLPANIQPTTMPTSGVTSKPPHGTEEWHKLRRENHKEVERRRRETINQGIKELAALIPTPDPNKAQILQRAVEYIKRLKENESNNIEKWTLEKLLTDQAVAELSASNEKLKQELERAYREIEQWKKLVNKDEKK